MNHKGQTLVAFVIIVPVFLLFMAFVVDTGYMLKEETKLSSITKTILKTTYQMRMSSSYQEQVVHLYQENGIDLANIEIEAHEDYVTIQNQYQINSIFGKVIGFKHYDINLKMKAYDANNKIIVNKE